MRVVKQNDQEIIRRCKYCKASLAILPEEMSPVRDDAGEVFHTVRCPSCNTQFIVDKEPLFKLAISVSENDIETEVTFPAGAAFNLKNAEVLGSVFAAAVNATAKTLASSAKNGETEKDIEALIYQGIKASAYETKGQIQDENSKLG